MLLGVGTAHSDAEIIDEFHALYRQNCAACHWKGNKDRFNAPFNLRRRIGKPILEWTEADVYGVLHDSNLSPSTVQAYSTFVAYLLLRGYFRATLRFFDGWPADISRLFPGPLAPLRQRVSTTMAPFCSRQATLNRVGRELNILVQLTTYIGRPLESITRPQFEAFRSAAKNLRLEQHGSAPWNSSLGITLGHIEKCLIAWGYLPPAPATPSAHERRMMAIRSPVLRQTLDRYIAACAVRLQPKGVQHVREEVPRFFLWAQEQVVGEQQRDASASRM